MALEIFKLFGSIFVDNEKANESITKTDEKAQGVGKTLLKGVGTAAKWGAGLTAAAGAGATALGSFAIKTSESAAMIEKFSAQTGTTVEEYQRLDQVFKQSGWSMEQAAGDFSALNEKMLDSLEGSGESYDMFQKLGVSVTDASGNLRNTGDVFNDTMKALQGMTNETERNATASILLGTTGEELASVMNMTNTEFEKVKSNASIVSEEDIQRAADFRNTWDTVKTSLGNLAMSAGASLIPVMQQLADIVIANMPMIQSAITMLTPIITQMFENLLPPLIQLVQMLLPTIIQLFSTIVPIIVQIISEILPVFTELLNLLLPPLLELVQTLLPPLLEVVSALMPVFKTIIELLKPIIQLFMSLLKPITDLITSAIAPLTTQLAGLINNILKPIIPVIEKVAGIIKNVLSAAFEAIAPYIENVKGYFQGLIDFLTGVFTGDWNKAFEGVKAIVKNVFEAMVNIVKAPVNFIIKGINSFIRGLNKLKIPDWVPAVGGKGISIPEIPMLAKGGNIEKAGRVLVGEEGPEFLDLPKGATVSPLDKASSNISTSKMESLLSAILEAIIQGASIYINGKEVAKATVQDMSKELASLNKVGGRKVGVST